MLCSVCLSHFLSLFFYLNYVVRGLPAFFIHILTKKIIIIILKLLQVAAISEQAASESSEESLKDNSLNPPGWKSFDMAAVVAATEDLFLFIFSKKGSRVRVFLLRDIIGTVDIVLQDEVFGCSSDEKRQSRSEVCSNHLDIFASNNIFTNQSILEVRFVRVMDDFVLFCCRIMLCWKELLMGFSASVMQ